MSLGERLREMLDPGTTQGGAPSPNGPTRRRPRPQAQPVNSSVRSYDIGDSGRPMPRAQWIGLGVVAALAVAVTAGLVFFLMTMRSQTAQTATPTPLAFATTPTVGAQSVATIFASPVVGAPPAVPAVTPQPTIQRLQVANAGGGGVNLRRDPGQGGERLSTLPEGTLVEIVGPDRTVDGMNWRNVRTLQGDVGWIAADFLAAEGAAPIAAIPGSGATILPVATAPGASGASGASAPRPTTGVASASATRGQVGNTGGQGANIRSEPGSSGRVLKTLPDGANLEVLGPEKEVDGTIWRQVRDPATGVTGWIVRGAVAPAGSMPTPVAPRTTPASGPTAAPKPAATAAPGGAGPTAAPKPANTPAPGGNPGPTVTPGPPPGNLPVIIQPATPRATSGAAPAATPKPSGGAATPKPSTP